MQPFIVGINLILQAVISSRIPSVNSQRESQMQQLMRSKPCVPLGTLLRTSLKVNKIRHYEHSQRAEVSDIPPLIPGRAPTASAIIPSFNIREILSSKNT